MVSAYDVNILYYHKGSIKKSLWETKFESLGYRVAGGVDVVRVARGVNRRPEFEREWLIVSDVSVVAEETGKFEWEAHFRIMPT
jgi:hypothetical protein